MKQVTIRECAVDALKELKNDLAAGKLLLDMCVEAIWGEPIEFDGETFLDTSSHRAVYAAVSPDIKASVVDPADSQIVAVPQPFDANRLFEGENKIIPLDGGLGA